MKVSRWLLPVGLAGIVILVVIAYLLPKRQPPEALTQTPPASVEPIEKVEIAAPVPVAPAPERPAPAQPAVVVSPPPPANIAPESSAPPDKTIRVKAGQALATVNGVAITLKDLIPLPKEKEGMEQVLSTERYDFLLNRAVDQELAFQTAREQGVELTEEQQRQLAKLRARSERLEPGVFDTVQQNPANAEFELRDFSALLLQTTLAAKAGVPSPNVNSEQVQEYYQQHQNEYGQLPDEPEQRRTAWEKIDAQIREKLAPQIQAEHQEKLEQYLKQLKTAARISTYSPNS